ncbi:symmetrical bis(5'-nucleosyl)-tetraphosphatase [Candidimonas nitroreducens]|uniref:bis(5'-nucleosyl)-tetraphosphatase (symmetrical) n=1 Tax=Candidimonas nitroreducens TaxID=683354 RepID=A0A225MDS8_9BURK|nr:symmetrical bis(5'-nucleosyl)-tetraphosphatase [Candidimonas nitroreducens]OWT58210.1 bis(5'-nucleosyl)-tetraphosphatase (symmetrical) [Candidimonas nitroreducens]
MSGVPGQQPEEHAFPGADHAAPQAAGGAAGDSGDIWIIGDLQGCCTPLGQLLEQPEIAGDPAARYWFAGDLVNRGPDSLGALRRVKQMGDRAVAVLGNHDLHLLAVAAGIRPPGKSDTLQDVLDAPDSQELIDWLRHRPLAHYEHRHLLVHAGVLPCWDVPQTLALAAEVEQALRGPGWQEHLAKMYGNRPVQWKDSYHGGKRMRIIINALTRMRMCDAQGHIELPHKGPPSSEAGLMPWFDVPGRAIAAEDTVVFGHWSALGLLLRPDAICLDTGCVWGGKLSALRLRDRRLVQVPCTQYLKPASD